MLLAITLGLLGCMLMGVAIIMWKMSED